ncbi:hypothetical protein CSHISOI_08061 [Colletotrichum shisoi]|uniref:Uncharacterized protein n=1 Tax=Colletotrichum shisoi TaxID=2078593 RepID=A0A5Q4BK86_9PEZI|nr:hypothetical protein CSHISOI_08061 [Colletotrichum shisoi]
MIPTRKSHVRALNTSRWKNDAEKGHQEVQRQSRTAATSPSRRDAQGVSALFARYRNRPSRVQKQYPWRWDSPPKKQARLQLVWRCRPRPHRRTHRHGGTQPNSANCNLDHLLTSIARRHCPS